MARTMQTAQKSTGGRPNTKQTAKVTKCNKTDHALQHGIFRISAIVAARQQKKRGRKLDYHVKWKGYEGTSEEFECIPEEELATLGAKGMATLHECVHGLPRKEETVRGEVTEAKYDVLVNLLRGRRPSEAVDPLPGLEKLFQVDGRSRNMVKKRRMAQRETASE